MQRSLLVVAIVSLLGWNCIAQTSTADSPATKEDIEKYLEVTHSRDMARKLMDSMSQGMRQMLHEQYLKHKDELPPDYESRMTARMDAMLQNMPWDEMMQAVAPVYQKHLTKGDIDNLIAFYSSPTGEKLMRELPSILTESMQTMTPIMSKYIERVQQRLREETNEMIAQSRKVSNHVPSNHD